MNNINNTSQFEEDICQSFGVPEIRSEFVNKVYGEIMQHAEAKPRKRHKFLGLRPAWTVALTILSLIIVVTLVIGPKRVYAEFMKLFGYIPEVGFVNLDEVRVLENGVTQRHDDRELTVQRGLITPYSTDLWLEFSDEARPIDDAWLETPDGLRFELLNWSYSPDESGSQGVVAHFPPLPIDINQVTLALPEGWRIPLNWMAGSESDLTPADIIQAPTYKLEENSNSAPVVNSTGEPAACSEVMEIEFCVQAAARAEGEMQVLIEAVLGGEYTPGSSFSPSMFDVPGFGVPGEAENITLSDGNDNLYPINSEYIQVQGDPLGLISTLSFPDAQELQGRLSLNIPAVLVSVPLSEEITIDLGEKPEAGQTLVIDQTIDVGGFPVHFSQAVLEGQGETSLRLMLTSDLFDDSAPIRPHSLEPGRPEGIDDLYGAGSSLDHLSIHVELMQQSGLKTGILRIPVISGSLKVRGPFTLTFDAPGEQPATTPEPQIVENAPFEPLPSGEPLPMDTFRYSGRVLRSGDLLSVVLGDGQSTLYAASPDSGFTPEQVAVLPGQVLAVYPHPDRLGIDYITGEYDVETSTIIYSQLYTLRFGELAPRLLVGQFEHSAFYFDWSYDGRFLGFTTRDEQPGQNEWYSINLIDLNCRTTGACNAITLDTDDQELYQYEWSPNDYRMALGGVPQDQEFGSSDIFLLNFDAENGKTTLTNLTLSPTIDDQAPVQWTLNGDALLYVCSTGETDINEYSLCRNNLNEGNDEVVVPLLPWNMHSIALVENRWLVDRCPVLQNGIFSLRAYDLQSGQTDTLRELSTKRKRGFIETSISPDGQWVTANVNDLGGLFVLNIENHESGLSMPAEEGPYLVTWVK